jgi:hypothetical protein
MDQHLDRQEQQLREVGCECIFFEKMTGTKRDRPELGVVPASVRRSVISPTNGIYLTD